MTGVNGLKDLFDQFAALKNDPQAMWEFYSGLSTDLKIIVWAQFPEYQRHCVQRRGGHHDG